MCQQENTFDFEIAVNFGPKLIEDAKTVYKQLEDAKKLFDSADSLSENAEVISFFKELARLNYRGAKLILTVMPLRRAECDMFLTAEEKEKFDEILSRPIPLLEE